MNISEIYHNHRPAGELTPQENASYDTLEALGIEYDCLSSDPADTMDKCDAITEAIGAEACKNLFLCNRQKTVFYLLCMPPHKAFYTKELGKQLGSSRLSFAPEEKLWELLRCTPGSASVMGLIHDTEHQVHLVIDNESWQKEYFACHPCNCSGSLKLKTSDLLHKFLPHTGHEPTFVELTGMP